MTESETREHHSFEVPALHYSSPAPQRIFPRGVTYGCGAASLLILVIVFIGGALASSGRLNELVDFAVGMSAGELDGMYAADVTPARKKSVDSEISRMREKLRSGEISVAKLQPFLETLRSTTSDRRVTAEEAATIESAARKITASARR